MEFKQSLKAQQGQAVGWAGRRCQQHPSHGADVKRGWLQLLSPPKLPSPTSLWYKLWNKLSPGQEKPAVTACERPIPQYSGFTSFFQMDVIRYSVKQFEKPRGGEVFRELPPPLTPEQDTLSWAMLYSHKGNKGNFFLPINLHHAELVVENGNCNDQ